MTLTLQLVISWVVQDLLSIFLPVLRCPSSAVYEGLPPHLWNYPSIEHTVVWTVSFRSPMGKRLTEKLLLYSLIYVVVDSTSVETTLVSPYLDKIYTYLSTSLDHKLRRLRKAKLVLITRDRSEKELRHLRALLKAKRGLTVETRALKNLHSKIYINRKQLLLTSANLRLTSLQRNFEIGIYTTERFTVEQVETLIKTLIQESREIK